MNRNNSKSTNVYTRFLNLAIIPLTAIGIYSIIQEYKGTHKSDQDNAVIASHITNNIPATYNLETQVLAQASLTLEGTNSTPTNLTQRAQVKPSELETQ